MAVEYTCIEHVDMRLALGECRRNSATAVIRCEEKYPNGRVPNRRTFLCADQRICETKAVRPIMVDAGRPHSSFGRNILAVVGKDPSLSTRRVSARLGVSHYVVYRALREQLCPYHVHRVQVLLSADTNANGCFISVPRIPPSLKDS
jgi:hypothetical protein